MSKTVIRGRLIKQKHGKIMLVQNKPMPPLTQSELDKVYSLPYARAYHPSYEKLGGVPGIKEVEFSITHNRGCFGACNFCSIAFHQGRYVTSRSKKSIIAEAEKLTHMPGFKGYIHDVGGPTANFRKPSCTFQEKHGLCKGKKCLAPKPCKNLSVDHSEYLDILRQVRSLPKVKKVFIRSGIRYDYLLEDKDDTFFKELVEHHVSGQLKVAPEHCSASVLDKMGKPHIEAYIKFSRRYFEYTGEINKEQYLVPYLMSSHPGSTLDDAIELALFLKKNHIQTGAGAGFLSHAGHGVHLHVLHRAGPVHAQAGVCGENAGGKGHAARTAAILRAEEHAAGAQGAAAGSSGRPDPAFVRRARGWEKRGHTAVQRGAPAACGRCAAAWRRHKRCAHGRQTR